MASPPVPKQEFRELYDVLKEVKEVASEHISLSRLQLAQRGLESEEPVIRIASASDSLHGLICSKRHKNGRD